MNEFFFSSRLEQARTEATLLAPRPTLAPGAKLLGLASELLIAAVVALVLLISFSSSAGEVNFLFEESGPYLHSEGTIDSRPSGIVVCESYFKEGRTSIGNPNARFTFRFRLGSNDNYIFGVTSRHNDRPFLPGVSDRPNDPVSQIPARFHNTRVNSDQAIPFVTYQKAWSSSRSNRDDFQVYTQAGSYTLYSLLLPRGLNQQQAVFQGRLALIGGESGRSLIQSIRLRCEKQ